MKLFGLVVAWALLSPAAALAQSESIRAVREPFSDTVMYECDGVEPVDLEGTYTRQVFSTTDGQGVTHRVVGYTLQGVAGTGASSGDRYVAVTQEHSIQKISFAPDGERTVEVRSMLMLELSKPGSDADAYLTFTVDATFIASQEEPIEESIGLESGCRP